MPKSGLLTVTRRVEDVSEEWVSHCARSGALVLESEPEEWVPHRRVTVVLVLWPMSTTPPRPERLTDGVKTSEEWVPRLSDDTEEWVAAIAEWVSRCIRGRVDFGAKRRRIAVWV